MRLTDLAERQTRTARGLSTDYGIVVEFAAGSDYRIKTQSLERRDDGIALLNIRELPVPQPDGSTRVEEFATVRIPPGKLEIFETIMP